MIFILQWLKLTIKYKLVFFIFYFAGCLYSLLTSAKARLPSAFATSTLRIYQSAFRLYMSFLTFLSINPSQVNVDVLLSYLEFLHINGKSVSQIQNSLSALKSRSLFYSLPTTIFSDHKIMLYIKALQKTAPLNIQLKTIIDIPGLKQLALTCDSTYMGQIFKAMYLLLYYRFTKLIYCNCYT